MDGHLLCNLSQLTTSQVFMALWLISEDEFNLFRIYVNPNRPSVGRITPISTQVKRKGFCCEDAFSVQILHPQSR